MTPHSFSELRLKVEGHFLIDPHNYWLRVHDLVQEGQGLSLRASIMEEKSASRW